MSKSTLKPDIKQMLGIGKGCGLSTLSEAYDNYMNHYDCFFLISDYKAQHAEFIAEMTYHDLLHATKDGMRLKGMSIDEALAKLC